MQDNIEITSGKHLASYPSYDNYLVANRDRIMSDKSKSKKKNPTNLHESVVLASGSEVAIEKYIDCSDVEKNYLTMMKSGKTEILDSNENLEDLLNNDNIVSMKIVAGFDKNSLVLYESCLI